MCRCCRRIWPRPTASSWPASSSRRRPAAAALAVAAGFSLAGLNAYSGVHEVDKNSRCGGGDRSRRRRRVHRDRPAPTPLRHRRPRPRRPSTPTARTRSARTSSRAGTARRAPSATARATGNASTGPTSSTTRCPRRRRSFRSSPTDTSFTTNECQAWQLTDAPLPAQGPGDLLGQLGQLAPIIARNPAPPPPSNP